MDETRLKYLDMLQSVIARMAGNQFTLRTWSVALGTAVIGFAAAKDGNPKAAAIAALPAVVFWILDAWYLALERKFRDLFSSASRASATPNFSFAAKFTGKEWFSAARSPAVWLVHAPVMLLAIAIGAWAWTHQTYPPSLAK